MVFIWIVGFYGDLFQIESWRIKELSAMSIKNKERV